MGSPGRGRRGGHPQREARVGACPDRRAGEHQLAVLLDHVAGDRAASRAAVRRPGRGRSAAGRRPARRRPGRGDGAGVTGDPAQQRVAVVQPEQGRPPPSRSWATSRSTRRPTCWCRASRVSSRRRWAARTAGRSASVIPAAAIARSRPTSRRPPAASLRSPSSRNASSPWACQRLVVTSRRPGRCRTAVRRQWSAAVLISASASAGSPATISRASSRPSATLTSSWATDERLGDGAYGVVEPRARRPRSGTRPRRPTRRCRAPRRAAGPGRGRCTGRTAAGPARPTATSATPSRAGSSPRSQLSCAAARRCRADSPIPPGTPTTSLIKRFASPSAACPTRSS